MNINFLQMVLIVVCEFFPFYKIKSSLSPLKCFAIFLILYPYFQSDAKDVVKTSCELFNALRFNAYLGFLLYINEKGTD